ncbi:hypothetical protein J2T38_002338 [Neisseria perflava]|nr:hypothetical protein [Neisseria perflava]
MNVLKKYGQKSVVAGAMAGGSAAAMADVDISTVGTQAATAIAGFATVVSAIGVAGLSVVVLAAAFKFAFGMIKAVK